MVVVVGVGHHHRRIHTKNTVVQWHSQLVCVCVCEEQTPLLFGTSDSASSVVAESDIRN